MMNNMSISKVSRRSFLKGSALAGLGIAASGSALSLFGCTSKDDGGSSSEAQGNGNSTEKVVWTHCAVNCGSTCALQCHVVDDEIKWIESDNTGSSDMDQPQLRACLRGRSLRRWLQDPDRLNYPMKRVGKRGEGKYEQISWDEAIETIASELKRIRETYTDEAVFNAYSSGVSSGIMGASTVSRLLNLTGGSVNYYGTYSSAHITAAATYTYGGGNYGSNFLTLQDNELVVMFGNSPADTRMGGGGHTHDLAWMREAKNLEIINIDVRLNDSVCGQGGEWIPIRPGTDGALCAALAYEIISNDWTDEDFLHKYCVGYDEESMPESAKGQNRSYKDYILGTGYDKVAKTPEWAAKITLIPAEKIKELARKIGTTKPVYICQGYGSQRHSNGEITSRAIMMLPQLVGQIGIPGTSDGRREGRSAFALAGFPAGENPIETSIPFFMWPDAIKRGTELTPLNAGLRNADSLSSNFKFIFNYGGNCLTNQHSDINGTHDMLVDDTLCEFIVTSEVFMTDSAKYSDIIIPDLTLQEQYSISANGYADNMEAVIYGQPVYEPKFERRGIYEVCSDIAAKLDVEDEFTDGGKSREDWLKQLLEESREVYPELPDWDAGMEQGVWKRTPEPTISLKDFIDDPENNPLPTPTGKIEIYSETLAEFAETWELADDEVISPIPEFDPGFESYVNLTSEHPLLITGYHYKAHTHSSYANNEIIEGSAPHEAWVNPVDAEERGISDGDSIRIFNDRGEIRIQAKVTPRIVPGTVTIPQGKWHDADMDGDRIDHGGNINTLTIYRPTPLAKANPQHSNIGQIEKV